MVICCVNFRPMTDEEVKNKKYIDAIDELIGKLRELNLDKGLPEYEELLVSEWDELIKAKQAKKLFSDYYKNHKSKLEEGVILEEADCLLIALQMRDIDSDWQLKTVVVPEVDCLIFKYDNETLTSLQLASILYKAERTIERLKEGYYDTRQILKARN